MQNEKFELDTAWDLFNSYENYKDVGSSNLVMMQGPDKNSNGQGFCGKVYLFDESTSKDFTYTYGEATQIPIHARKVDWVVGDKVYPVDADDCRVQIWKMPYSDMNAFQSGMWDKHWNDMVGLSPGAWTGAKPWTHEAFYYGWTQWITLKIRQTDR